MQRHSALPGTLLLVAAVLVLIQAVTAQRSFVVSGNEFVKDGQPFRIVGGSMHYFRSLPEQWPARLRALRACGLNTVTTYVPWNLHEPSPGKYAFDARLNITRFLEAAQREGLLVIVRPPPYICAEFEFGGLPAWLLNEEGLQLRCSEPRYLKRVDSFLNVFLPKIAPFQYSRGGPVIALQVENEYGSYGNDHAYLRHLEVGFRQNGIDAILFSSNGAVDQLLVGGAAGNVLRTVNFGTGANVAQNLDVLRKYQPSGPLFVTEFWDGWFDHWGEEHHTTTPLQSGRTLEAILAHNASVNLYMAFGGTNFGFTNGANSPYQATTTSYDYDAPVNESGDATPKCSAFRAIISKYVAVPSVPIQPPSPKRAYGTVAMTHSAVLFDESVLAPLTSKMVESVATLPMEALGQNFGFILYSTTFEGPLSGALDIRGLADRALVFVDGSYMGVLQRNTDFKLTISAKATLHRLDILVENMGRINFGPELADKKGITDGVCIGGQHLYHWTIRALPLDDLARVPFVRPAASTRFVGPTFYRAVWNISAESADDGALLEDTFLELPGWTKGFAVVNGFNLGRYWRIGPQQSLYVPGPLLRVGQNELVVLELHGPNDVRAPAVKFTSFARYGKA